jgi:EAL domain-containing protein (putative c-di-GMP-specific phosphodiesterase class I)
VLKEFRNLIQMLDDLDNEAPLPVPAAAERAAVEIPQSVEAAAAQIVAAPSSFIFDTEPIHANALAATLSRSGIGAEIYAETSPFVRGLLTSAPSMIFLEVAGQGDAAIDALFAMGERNYAGGVQLMGADASPVMDIVRRMGQRHSLQMLPSQRKPLEPQLVRDILVSQNFKINAAPTASLAEALNENWVEFWYQPKIDLVKRQIAGVETFARIRHPELGTLQPAVFMKGATESDLLRLAQRALAAALRAAGNFSEVGINLRVAVNIPVKALFDLSIATMAREFGPKTSRWPGLLLDVTADQLLRDFQRVEAIGPELAACNVRLAIDDFGKANLPLAALRQLPLAELKLDRGFVQGCAEDQGRAVVSRSVIELAHHLGATAVAVGIERVADMKALAAMGCDVGQGFLFGQPMPEEELVGILLKRAVAAAPEKQTVHAQQQAVAAAASQFAPRSPLAPKPAVQQAPRPKLKRAVWD